MELLDKLQKWIFKTVGPSLASSIEPLAHHRNGTSLSLFYSYCFGKCSSELTELVPLPHFQGRCTRYSFSVILRWYKDLFVKNLFPDISKLWNSLSVKCFPLTHDLDCRLFLNKFPACIHLFCASYPCNYVSRSGCSALNGVNPN